MNFNFLHDFIMKVVTHHTFKNEIVDVLLDIYDKDIHLNHRASQVSLTERANFMMSILNLVRDDGVCSKLLRLTGMGSKIDIHHCIEKYSETDNPSAKKLCEVHEDKLLNKNS